MQRKIPASRESKTALAATALVRSRPLRLKLNMVFANQAASAGKIPALFLR